MFRWTDYEMVPKPQSDFAKIFGAPREYEFVRKASYRGGSGRRLHHISGLTREEALHWLAHDPHGRSFARERGEPISDLADLLVEASMRPTEKRNEDTNMSNPQLFTKAVADLGEHKYTSIIKQFASNNKLPNETASQAFTRIFTEDSAQGAAIRKFWQISKQGGSAPLDDDEAEEEAEGVEDDALEELKELATAERRRNPKLTKAQAFTKAYTDPANAKLAQRERAQNRPR